MVQEDGAGCKLFVEKNELLQGCSTAVSAHAFYSNLVYVMPIALVRRKLFV